MNTYCESYWKLHKILDDLLTATENGRPIDPRAIKRAQKACEKHKQNCQECKR